MGMDLRESLVVREYGTYEEAQAAVDRLSDAGFPVQHVRIVGHDIHSVEQVTARITSGRAALLGAGGGAWFGLLVGLLFSIFATGTGVIVTALGSLALGAFWGALFGFVVHWATDGSRDFSSISGLVAKRYTVEVDAGYLDAATTIVDRA
jgi:hypothetical protein